MKIIVFCGLIGSGKDTAASYLNKESIVKLSFASSLKDAVSCVFNWNRVMLEGDTHESRMWREKVDEWWSKRLNIPNLTPRFVLQNWGTDVLRKYFHPDIWLASLENKIQKLQNVNTIIIADCRFPNEYESLKKFALENGHTISFNWIRRFPMPFWVENYIKHKIIPTSVHYTEYSWLDFHFDNIIDNDGNLEDLKNKILKLF